MEHSLAPFTSVTVAPFQLRGLSEVPEDAVEMARRLTEYVAESLPGRDLAFAGLAWDAADDDDGARVEALVDERVATRLTRATRPEARSSTTRQPAVS